MDGGNETIIAAVIAAVASLVSAGIALYNAKDSKKGAAQRDEVNNRTNSEIAMFEQDAENKRNETQIDASIVWSARVEWIQNVRRATADLLTAINNLGCGLGRHSILFGKNEFNVCKGKE